MRVGAGKITVPVLSALFRYGRLRDRAVFFFRPQGNSVQSGSATKQRCLVRTMRITVETALDSLRQSQTVPVRRHRPIWQFRKFFVILQEGGRGQAESPAFLP